MISLHTRSLGAYTPPPERTPPSSMSYRHVQHFPGQRACSCNAGWHTYRSTSESGESSEYLLVSHLHLPKNNEVALRTRHANVSQHATRRDRS